MSILKTALRTFTETRTSRMSSSIIKRRLPRPSKYIPNLTSSGPTRQSSPQAASTCLQSSKAFCRASPTTSAKTTSQIRCRSTKRKWNQRTGSKHPTSRFLCLSRPERATVDVWTSTSTEFCVTSTTIRTLMWLSASSPQKTCPASTRKPSRWSASSCSGNWKLSLSRRFSTRTSAIHGRTHSSFTWSQYM